MASMPPATASPHAGRRGGRSVRPGAACRGRSRVRSNAAISVALRNGAALSWRRSNRASKTSSSICSGVEQESVVMNGRFSFRRLALAAQGIDPGAARPPHAASSSSAAGAAALPVRLRHQHQPQAPADRPAVGRALEVRAHHRRRRCRTAATTTSAPLRIGSRGRARPRRSGDVLFVVDIRRTSTAPSIAASGPPC